MFTPLNNEQIEKIVQLQIDKVIKMLKENDITLEVTDKAIKCLAKAGFDPEFGARPVKRAIQRYLLNDLSKKLLAGTVNSEHPIQVDAEYDELVFSN